MQDERRSGADPKGLERRVLRRVFWPGLAILIGVGIVNALTLLTEAERAGTTGDAALPWVLELSSISVLILLVPLVVVMVRLATRLPRRWYVLVPAYLVMSLVFSGLHVLGVVGLRIVVFWAVWGRPYSFFDAPLDALFYEYRKDLLPFAVIVVVCHLARRLEENRQDAIAARAEILADRRLALRLGNRTIWLDTADFDWAEAAGNYVEVHVSGSTHLARMSLSGLEDMLKQAGVPAVRVHRSRIVNRARVSEILPTRDGDFVVRLLNRVEVRGSRRYRDILTAN